MKTRHYVVIVVFSVFFLAVMAIGRWMRPFDLRTEQANARAAGIPLSAAEFVRTPPPADQDAGPIYKELVKVMERNRLDTRPIDRTGSSDGDAPSVPPEKTVALRTFLASRPDVARLVHAAVAKPHAFFPHTWTVDELFPYMAQMRDVAKWIRWESLLLARQGQYVEAVHHQALGFRIAYHAQEDPVLISYLVGVACEAITLRGFVDILREAGPNVSVSDAVRKEISAFHPAYNLTTCLNGEMVMGLTIVHSLGSIRDLKALASPDGPQLPSRKHHASGFIRWYYLDPSEAIYTHWMSRFIQASREGTLLERNAAMARVQADLERDPKKQPTYMLTSLLMPVFSKAGEREVYAAAQRAVISAGAAVMGYRAQTGQWPASLNSMGIPVPTDPYTLKPLGYRVEGGGFTVYSAGDTGRFTASPKQKASRESFFRYPYRPTERATRSTRSRTPMPSGPPRPGGPPTH